MKQCYKCNKEKEYSEFSLNKAKRDGYSDQCRECHKKLRRKHYLKNRKKVYQQVRLKKKEMMEWVKSLKDKPCTDCKIKYPPYVMDFDHKTDKKFQISKAASKSKQLILEEIAKCDLVCANCHRERTHARLM